MGKHIGGLILAISIIIAGIVYNPFSTDASALHWGFQKASNENQAQAGPQFDALLQKYDAYYKGSASKKTLYLTFDNGYENGKTASILDTLKKEKIHATFFLTGHYVESATELVNRMIKDGHEIGNHTLNHPNMAHLSTEKMIEEWKSFDELLASKTKVKKTRFVRPPEGVFNEEMLRVAKENGYQHMFWSVAFVDWYANKPQGKAYAYNELVKQLHPGAIILMHTVSQDNADALPDFIQTAKEKGYTFSTLDALVK
ncbi:polysaccharide deacetylase [Paenisporosarcina cavernae]|uniref:Polysaccharide deacetylase n=2 Tax=Paenisporosarcina cavernae TaxID=2320858 RepID=A0A385YU85_9BACL|nr:polysaccharide deacetylase [Paenisporosarcina cavernae]